MKHNYLINENNHNFDIAEYDNDINDVIDNQTIQQTLFTDLDHTQPYIKYKKLADSYIKKITFINEQIHHIIKNINANVNKRSKNKFWDDLFFLELHHNIVDSEGEWVNIKSEVINKITWGNDKEQIKYVPILFTFIEQSLYQNIKPLLYNPCLVICVDDFVNDDDNPKWMRQSVEKLLKSLCRKIRNNKKINAIADYDGELMHITPDINKDIEITVKNIIYLAEITKNFIEANFEKYINDIKNKNKSNNKMNENKLLYEKIMHNVAKHVKRALNESEGLDITLEDIEDRIRMSEDGIYVAYHDHLRMDAWDVYVVRDHSFEKHHYIMMSDSDYYHTTGIVNGVKTLKKENPDLPIYYCNIGWSTFSGTYSEYGFEPLERMVKALNADGVYDVLNNRCGNISTFRPKETLTVPIDDWDEDDEDSYIINEDYQKFDTREYSDDDQDIIDVHVIDDIAGIDILKIASKESFEEFFDNSRFCSPIDPNNKEDMESARSVLNNVIKTLFKTRENFIEFVKCCIERNWNYVCDTDYEQLDKEGWNIWIADAIEDEMNEWKKQNRLDYNALNRGENDSWAGDEENIFNKYCIVWQMVQNNDLNLDLPDHPEE